MEEVFKLVATAITSGGPWAGVAALSLAANIGLIWTVKFLYKANIARQDANVAALKEVAIAISTCNTILQMLVTKRSR